MDIGELCQISKVNLRYNGHFQSHCHFSFTWVAHPQLQALKKKNPVSFTILPGNIIWYGMTFLKFLNFSRQIKKWDGIGGEGNISGKNNF